MFAPADVALQPFTVVDEHRRLYQVEKGPDNALFAVEAFESSRFSSVAVSDRTARWPELSLDLERERERGDQQADLERKVARLQDQLHASYQSMDSHLSGTADHLRRMQELRFAFEEKEREYQNVQADLSYKAQLLHECEALRKSEAVRHEEEKARLIANKNEEIAQYSERVTKLMDDLRRERERYSNLLLDRKSSPPKAEPSTLLVEKEKEVAALKEKVHTLMLELEDKDARVNHLYVTNAKLVQENSVHDIQVKELEQDLRLSVAQCTALSKDLERCSAQLQDQCFQLESQRAGSSQQLKEAQENQRTLQMRVDVILGEVESLHAAKLTLNAENEALRADLKAQETRLLEAGERQAALALQLQALGRENERLKADAKPPVDPLEMEHVKGQLSAKRSECETYVKHLETLQGEFSRMRDVLQGVQDEREREREAHRAALRSLEQERAALQSELHDQSSRLMEESGRLRASGDSLAQLREDRQELLHTITVLEETVAAHEQTAMRRCQAAADAAQRQADRSVAELRATEERLQQLSATLVLLERERDSARCQAEEQKAELDRLRQTVKQLQQELQTQRQAAAELSLEAQGVRRRSMAALEESKALADATAAELRRELEGKQRAMAQAEEAHRQEQKAINTRLQEALSQERATALDLQDSRLRLAAAEAALVQAEQRMQEVTRLAQRDSEVQVQKLETSLRELTTERNSAVRNLETAHSRLEASEARVLQLTQERAALQGSADAHQAESLRLRRELQAAQLAGDERLRGEAALRTELAALETQTQREKERHKAATEELQALKSRAEDAERQLEVERRRQEAAWEGERLAWRAERQALQQAQESLQSQLAGVSAQNGALAKDLESRADATDAALAEWRRRCAALQDDVAALRRTLAEKEGALAHARDTEAAAQRRAEGLSRQLEDLTATHQQSLRDRSTSMEELARLRTAQELAQKEWEARYAVLEARLRDAAGADEAARAQQAEAVARLEADLTATRGELQALGGRLARHRADAEAAQAECEKLRAAVRKANSQCNTSGQHAADLTARLAEALQRGDALREQQTRAEAEWAARLSQTQARLEAEAIQKVETATFAFHTELSALRQEKVEAALTAKTDAAREAATHRLEVEKLGAQLQEARREVLEMKAELAAVLAEVPADPTATPPQTSSQLSWRLQLTELRSVVLQLTSDRDNMQRAAASQQAAWAAAQRDAEDRAQRLEWSSAELTARLRETQRQLQQAREEVAAMERRYDELAASRKASASADVVAVEAELTALRKTLGQAQERSASREAEWRLLRDRLEGDAERRAEEGGRSPRPAEEGLERHQLWAFLVTVLDQLRAMVQTSDHGRYLSALKGIAGAEVDSLKWGPSLPALQRLFSQHLALLAAALRAKETAGFRAGPTCDGREHRLVPLFTVVPGPQPAGADQGLQRVVAHPPVKR